MFKKTQPKKKIFKYPNQKNTKQNKTISGYQIISKSYIRKLTERISVTMRVFNLEVECHWSSQLSVSDWSIAYIVRQGINAFSIESAAYRKREGLLQLMGERTILIDIHASS